MASYLVVKNNNNTMSAPIQTTYTGKPYLKVSNGYVDLTTDTMSGVQNKVKLSTTNQSNVNTVFTSTYYSGYSNVETEVTVTTGYSGVSSSKSIGQKSTTSANTNNVIFTDTTNYTKVGLTTSYKYSSMSWKYINESVLAGVIHQSRTISNTNGYTFVFYFIPGITKSKMSTSNGKTASAYAPSCGVTEPNNNSFITQSTTKVSINNVMTTTRTNQLISIDNRYLYVNNTSSIVTKVNNVIMTVSAKSHTDSFKTGDILYTKSTVSYVYTRTDTYSIQDLTVVMVSTNKQSVSLNTANLVGYDVSRTVSKYSYIYKTSSRVNYNTTSLQPGNLSSISYLTEKKMSTSNILTTNNISTNLNSVTSKTSEIITMTTTRISTTSTYRPLISITTTSSRSSQYDETLYYEYTNISKYTYYDYAHNFSQAELYSLGALVTTTRPFYLDDISGTEYTASYLNTSYITSHGSMGINCEYVKNSTITKFSSYSSTSFTNTLYSNRRYYTYTSFDTESTSVFPHYLGYCSSSIWMKSSDSTLFNISSLANKRLVYCFNRDDEVLNSTQSNIESDIEEFFKTIGGISSTFSNSNSFNLYWQSTYTDSYFTSILSHVTCIVTNTTDIKVHDNFLAGYFCDRTSILSFTTTNTDTLPKRLSSFDSKIVITTSTRSSQYDTTIII